MIRLTEFGTASIKKIVSSKFKINSNFIATCGIEILMLIYELLSELKFAKNGLYSVHFCTMQ